MPIISTSKPIVLNELYIGKTPELEEIEKYIDKVRKKYNYDVTKTNCCTDDYILKINRLIEKLFGFTNFALVFDTTYTANAYTIPIFTETRDKNWNPKNLITADEQGFKYKKEANVSAIVVVYLPLFMNERLTPADIVAVILHEIGHNFEIAISSIKFPTTKETLSELSFLSRVILDVILIFKMGTHPYEVSNKIIFKSLNSKPSMDGLVKIIKKYKKEVESDNILIRAKNKYLSILSLASSKISSISELGRLFKQSLTYILSPGAKVKYKEALDLYHNADKYKGQEKKLKKFYPAAKFKYSDEQITRFKGETIADNFATMYGYGANSVHFETIFLDVYYDIDTTVDRFQNSFFGQYYKALKLPSYLIQALTDEHPNEMFRCLDQANYLKQELRKKDLDPKMKKELLSQIDEIESITNKIYKNIDEDENGAYRKMTAYTIYKICDGDPRAKYAKDNFKEIEDAYQKHFEEDDE